MEIDVKKIAEEMIKTDDFRYSDGYLIVALNNLYNFEQEVIDAIKDITKEQ